MMLIFNINDYTIMNIHDKNEDMQLKVLCTKE